MCRLAGYRVYIRNVKCRTRQFTKIFQGCLESKFIIQNVHSYTTNAKVCNIFHVQNDFVVSYAKQNAYKDVNGS